MRYAAFSSGWWGKRKKIHAWGQLSIYQVWSYIVSGGFKVFLATCVITEITSTVQGRTDQNVEKSVGKANGVCNWCRERWLQEKLHGMGRSLQQVPSSKQRACSEGILATRSSDPKYLNWMTSLAKACGMAKILLARQVIHEKEKNIFLWMVLRLR